MRRMAIVVLVLLAVPVYCMAAEPADMRDLITGKAAPLALKLKDLDAGYMRFVSYGAGRGGGWLATAASYIGGTPFYTRGATIAIGGEKCLVAYAVQPKGPSYSSMMMYGRVREDAPEPQKITGDADLMVCLFNLRTLSPMTDVRRFDLKEELTMYQQYLQDFKEIMASQRAMEEPPQQAGDNLSKLAVAVQMYASDNDETLPPTADMDGFRKAIGEYVDSPDVFVDPDSGEPYALNPTVSGKRVREIEDPKNTIVIYQPKPGKDGRRGVALLEGSTRRLSDDQWNDLKAKSNIP